MKNRRKLLEFIMASTMLLLVYICAGKLPAMSSGSSKVTKQGENGKIIFLGAGHGKIGKRPENLMTDRMDS